MVDDRDQAYGDADIIRLRQDDFDGKTSRDSQNKSQDKSFQITDAGLLEPEDEQGIERCQGDAAQQLVWTVIGVAVYIVVLAIVKRSRDLELALRRRIVAGHERRRIQRLHERQLG